MNTVDFITLLHPVLAVVIVFPAIGIALNYAWQTRQRRLQTLPEGGKSKIPPTVGREHVQIGRWLAGSVVGITLVALAYSVVWGFGGILDKAKDGKLDPFQAIFIALMFVVTVGSFILLYRARPAHWRAIFAALTGMGLIVIGCQDGVWRLSNEWYWSHYYIGLGAAILMVISLTMIEEIYRDRTLRWRNAHIILNCIATLLFIGQGMTGTRDLLEIPLSWQKPAIYQCDFQNKTCGASLPNSDAPHTFVPRSHSLL
jgi:drug/metabolite transporter (DMT)-like permease